MDSEQHQGIRSKGNSYSTGKIFKGTLNQAPMKLKVSSIPAKHQNIIYHHPYKEAFGNSQPRFALNPTKTPGPGIYQVEKKSLKIQSKKGSNPFVSQSNLERFVNNINYYPSPATYSLEQNKKLFKNKSKSVFMSTKSASNAKAHDIFKFQIRQSEKAPGPGQYQNQNKMSKTISTSQIPFKSKIQRFEDKQSQAPPVGYYKINEHIIKPQTVKFTFPQKKANKFKREQYIRKIVGEQQLKYQLLGPGTYDPVNRKTQKAFKIVDTMYDRFGELKPVYNMAKNASKSSPFDTPYQAQKQYNISPPKTKGYSSMFKTKASRMPFQQPPLLGPGKYNPMLQTRKSYHINFKKKWV